jgi:beta-lactam-binding protein with PASTA domain
MDEQKQRELENRIRFAYESPDEAYSAELTTPLPSQNQKPSPPFQDSGSQHVSRFRSFLGFLFRLAVTVIVVFIVLTTISYLTIRHFISGEEVVVPNLVGMAPGEALERLQSLNLSIKLDKREYSEIVREGDIISQYPFPGTPAKAGAHVKVVLSKGPTLIHVPDLRGESYLNAGVKLRAIDLQVGNTSYLYSPEVKKGNVISQDPLPQSGVPRNYAVNLLVSNGPRPRLFLMPSLVNSTLKEAQSLLAKLDLTISQVSEKEQHGVQKGIILSQSPPAGTAVSNDTKIRLVVASGLNIPP